jgi:hypothetical protein
MVQGGHQQRRDEDSRARQIATGQRSSTGKPVVCAPPQPCTTGLLVIVRRRGCLALACQAWASEHGGIASNVMANW